ncbi:DUF4268 domain-containing protein [bacterium]|nr:DUF4268 domain-containing protein [bacterium]
MKSKRNLAARLRWTYARKIEVRDLNIGKLRRVPLREVWKHEALDFTTWLEQNIDIISESIELELISAEREQAAGAFSVDLVAEDKSGNTVVIENQLERSNHDHLGKLITYLVAMEAKAAVWIVSDPRPEHVAAITWLNESSSTSFYLLKLEAVQIEGSMPAPLLTLIVGPSDEAKEVGRTKQEMAERHTLRLKFWTQLLDRAKAVTKLHSGISPGKEGWVGAGAGKQGLNYNYVVRQTDAHVELYIDRGRDKNVENRAIFDKLKQAQAEIEEVFGGALEWQGLEGKRACRIRASIDSGGYKSTEDDWVALHDKMIGTMVKLEQAIAPRLSKLTV